MHLKTVKVYIQTRNKIIFINWHIHELTRTHTDTHSHTHTHPNPPTHPPTHPPMHARTHTYEVTQIMTTSQTSPVMNKHMYIRYKANFACND